jgi:hypothetical protein
MFHARYRFRYVGKPKIAGPLLPHDLRLAILARMDQA